MCGDEVRSLQVRVTEVRLPQVRAAEVRPFQVRAAKIRVLQACASEVRTPQIDHMQVESVTPALICWSEATKAKHRQPPPHILRRLKLIAVALRRSYEAATAKHCQACLHIRG